MAIILKTKDLQLKTETIFDHGLWSLAIGLWFDLLKRDDIRAKD